MTALERKVFKYSGIVGVALTIGVLLLDAFGALNGAIVTEPVVVPPAPVQASVYVVGCVGAGGLEIPEGPNVPFQAPDATHEVAFVVPQIRYC